MRGTKQRPPSAAEAAKMLVGVLIPVAAGLALLDWTGLLAVQPDPAPAVSLVEIAAVGATTVIVFLALPYLRRPM